jgi:hypothetical protein
MELRMRDELQLKLKHAFPVLYQDLWRKRTGMEYGILVADGWFELIWQLSEDLVMLEPELVASQVKEKTGSLRFRFRPFKVDESVIARVARAEHESSLLPQDD